MPPRDTVRPISQDESVLTSPLTAISLYSGAGGMDRGFIDAGVEVLWANDFSKHAVATYHANIGDHAVHGDVLKTEIPQDLSPDLVIGGPPCQGFSVIGRMDPSDVRSQHVFHMLDVVEDLRPRAFVLENVKALAVNPRWGRIRAALLARAAALGYGAKIFLLNAADYGVPQARERMFLIGIRDGEPVAPTPEEGTLPKSVRAALATLPAYGKPGNATFCPAKVVPAKNPIMRPSAYNGSLVFNGSGRVLALDAQAKTLPASMGGNATPIVDQLELETGAAPWIVEYHTRLMQGGKPRKTAPKRMRRITVEEAAALQTFPVGWDWQGPLAAQYHQIGNAVPPLLAYNVARAVQRALASAQSSVASTAPAQRMLVGVA